MKIIEFRIDCAKSERTIPVYAFGSPLPPLLTSGEFDSDPGEPVQL